jgi:hypothetical protein
MGLALPTERSVVLILVILVYENIEKVHIVNAL